MTNRQALIKRTFDFCSCLIALFFLAPVIAVCVLLSRLDTGASGLFVQRRIGMNGTPFDVYKIRTMKKSLNELDTTITIRNDPRITKLGATFRRFKLDELPQLWNVVKGDMSLVGPRPDVPGYADQLVGDDRQLLSIRPGITGPATIKYRDEELLLAKADDSVIYNDTVLYPDKTRLNLDYLRNWTLKTDIWYIAITVGLCQTPDNLIGIDSKSGSIQ